MMNHQSVLAAVAVATSTLFTQFALAQTPTQKLIPDQSTVSFVSKQMGVPVEGKFTKVDAAIAFDPKKPEASKIQVVMDINSAVIGDAETVRELRKAAWFDALKFPIATFTATSVKSLGNNKFDVAGSLVIKGNARAVSTIVTLSQKAGVTLVEGAMPIKRLDFKLGDGDWNDVSLVADEVVIKIKLAVSGIAAL